MSLKNGLNFMQETILKLRTLPFLLASLLNKMIMKQSNLSCLIAFSTHSSIPYLASYSKGHSWSENLSVMISFSSENCFRFNFSTHQRIKFENFFKGSLQKKKIKSVDFFHTSRKCFQKYQSLGETLNPHISGLERAFDKI